MAKCEQCNDTGLVYCGAIDALNKIPCNCANRAEVVKDEVVVVVPPIDEVATPTSIYGWSNDLRR